MSYNITKTNGTKLKELEENVIDFDTVSSIGLIGKLSPNYGETQSNNFVHLAENFASDKAPLIPLLGMVYFNTNDKSLYMCTDDVQQIWTKLVSMKFEPTKDPQTGDMYYDQENKQLFIYDESINKYGEWVLIGPDNYTNKRKYSTILQTSNNMSESNYEVAFESNTTNLITVKIVGSEKISSKSTGYGKRQPECSGWIYKMVVNSYMTTTGEVVKLLGSPTYEIIGQTDNATSWKVTPTINDNRLLITVAGNVKDILSSIDWEIDIEVLKV